MSLLMMKNLLNSHEIVLLEPQTVNVATTRACVRKRFSPSLQGEQCICENWGKFLYWWKFVCNVNFSMTLCAYWRHSQWHREKESESGRMIISFTHSPTPSRGFKHIPQLCTITLQLRSIFPNPLRLPCTHLRGKIALPVLQRHYAHLRDPPWIN